MSKKRKNQPTKKRIEHLYGTTVGNIDSLIIRVNPATGSVEFGHPMSNVYSEMSYERAKGPKVLTRIPQTARSVSFEAEFALETHYDLVFGVDTNTRTVNGRNVSVTGVISYKKATPPPGKDIFWKPDVAFAWEFIDLRTDQKENFGWLSAFEELIRRGVIRDNHRVGLIVDSDLGNIPAYNARTKPVFADTSLPQGVQLIYASADAGSENFANRVLQAADKASNQVLDMIAHGEVKFNECDKPSEWYEGRRIVYIDVEEGEAIPY
ncbi:hypothetical protein [Rhizobium sp. Root1204]|uniref:hypothetical protein n=1 Tax=Rhizobium sp. Root1204 TaxID=1736428 RepID=UPI000A4C5114|nr:hypothetical protein [Rhizobium sp. Root1204]